MFEDDSLKFRMFMLDLSCYKLGAIETDLADVMTPGFYKRVARMQTSVLFTSHNFPTSALVAFLGETD